MVKSFCQDDPNWSSSIYKLLRGITAYHDRLARSRLLMCRYSDIYFIVPRIVRGATRQVALPSCPRGSLRNRQEEAACGSLFSPKAGFEASEEIGRLIPCFPLSLGMGSAQWPLAPRSALESYRSLDNAPTAANSYKTSTNLQSQPEVTHVRGLLLFASQSYT